MMKLLLACSMVVVLLFLSLNANAQTQNPFEITNRLGTAPPDTTLQPVESPTEPVIAEEPILSTSPDIDLRSDTITVDTVRPAVPEVSFVEKRQKMLIDENPFNVSHIPLRSQPKKNTVVEEQRSRNEQTDSTESTRSDSTESPRLVLPISDKGTSKFMFWFFLIQLLLITSLLGINREFIKKINRSISNDNFAKLVSRDYNGGYNALFVIMYGLFILSLSIFIYLAVRHFFGISGFSKFLLILVSVFGVYLFRHIFLNFVGFVFPFTKTISYYDFMIILFNSYLGLLLIPINVLIAYAPDFIANIAIYIGITIIVISYLLRLLRGSLHAYTLVRNHVFHFFLYLCTCEIAPIFILVRFLSNSFSI